MFRLEKKERKQIQWKPKSSRCAGRVSENGKTLGKHRPGTQEANRSFAVQGFIGKVCGYKEWKDCFHSTGRRVAGEPFDFADGSAVWTKFYRVLHVVDSALARKMPG